MCYPTIVSTTPLGVKFCIFTPRGKALKMRISVKTNKNVIFFETLLSLLNSKDTKYHPLGNKVVSEFSDIENLESFKNFKNKYDLGNIPRHPYQYLFLSVNIYSSLKPKNLSPNDGFGPNRYKGYMEDIYPLIKQVSDESNFNGRYKEKVLPEYQEITKDIQSLFNKQSPGKILQDFWGKELTPTLIFIPDPLRIGGGSGISRGKTFFSVTGTIKKKNIILFEPSHMISNLFHEFSHSFFKKHLYSNKEYVEANIQICDSIYRNLEDNLSKKILKEYGSPSVYFEETFIRAVQIFLNKEFFSKYILEKENNQKSSDLLQRRREDGFIYIENFYNELKKDNPPISSYMKVLKSL